MAITGTANAAAAARLLAPGGRSPSIDGLIELASRLLADESGAPAVQVSLLTDVQVVPSAARVAPGTVGSRSSASDSLCTVTVQLGDALVVDDAPSDTRVSALGPVTSGAVGSYLGVPLRAGDGIPGALCAFSDRSRAWTQGDRQLLEELATAVVTQLEADAMASRLSSDGLRWELARQAAGVGSFDWHIATGHLEWDARMGELFGYRTDELPSRIETGFERVHPDDRPAVDAAVEQAVRSLGDYHAEFRVALPDGGERWVAARGRAFAHPDGQVERLIGTAVDVTDARAAKDEAARLLDSMAIGFVALDRHFDIVYLNAEGSRVVGRPPAELIGRNLWEEFPGLDQTTFGPAYRRAADEGEIQRIESYYPHLDGWFDVRIVPGPDGLAVYFLDVTERHLDQQRAEAATGRLALLEEVGRSLGDAGLDVEEAVTRLARAVTPQLADWSIVSFVEPRGLRDVGWWHADEAMRGVVDEYVRHRLVGRSDLGPVQDAFDRKQVVHVRSGLTERVLPTLGDAEAVRTLGVLRPESAVVVPLTGREGLIGVVTLLRDPERSPATDDEVALADEIGARAGLALDNARLYSAQRRVAEELQRSLLTTPPKSPFCRITARYVAAAEVASVGGDWYDAFTLPDGDVMVVIGDVMGHDTTSAAAMGQIRGVLRGIAWGGGGAPAEVLSGTDSALQGLAMATTATAAVASISARCDADGTRTLRWSNAGHPPPVLVHADGGADLLDAGGPDLLLGITSGAPRRVHECRLAPGDTLLLYTDGLVERRSEDLDDGLARLTARCAELADRDPDELCDAVLAGLLGGGTPDDDVAVIAVRITAAESGAA